MSLPVSPALLLSFWMLGTSLALFLRMGQDKRLARQHLRRIPEAELFLLAFLGGAPGGWLGMYLFRHKTRHLLFRLGFPLISLLQAAALLWLLFQKP